MRRVVIVGGGAIGSAIAYFLTRDPGNGEERFEVTVVERDFSYRQASSALSASSIRQQFSTAINIRMSLYGIDFLRNLGETLRVGDEVPDIGLVEPGYLYLASQAGAGVLRENHALQKAHAVDVALLTPDELKARFPWISTEGVELASLGLSGEGWYDGYSLLQAFRRKAVSQGVRYVQTHATGLRLDGRRATGVQIDGGETLDADVVVTATGLNLLALGGIELSVDGVAVSLPERLAYKGMMLSRVPNLVFTIGYTNASWTLKADLVAEYVCRLLEHMERGGYRQCMPVDDDPTLESRPLLDFAAGYVQRSLHLFPRGGSRAPWRLGMSYPQDVVTLRHRALEDGALRFSAP